MAGKILVTGGAGYLGSILVPDLLNLGYRVSVVDNFMYNQASLNHVCSHPNFSVTHGDIRVKETMSPLMRDADFIIPLAALVGAPACLRDPVGAHTTNYDALILMLRLISKDQCVLMPTTNSAYGSGNDDHFCTEESPLNPISKYAIDKVEIERRLLEHQNSISFRLATVFGMSPRMRIDLLVNDFVYRAIHDRFIVLFEGHFKRNYIHIRDVSRVFQHGIENFSKMRGQIYNVGLSDTNISKLELCAAINTLIPEFVYIEADVGKDPDQRNYVVSNEKIETTNYRTNFTLRDGIIELIKGFKMLKKSAYGNI